MQTFKCPYRGCQYHSTTTDDMDEHVALEHEDDDE